MLMMLRNKRNRAVTKGDLFLTDAVLIYIMDSAVHYCTFCCTLLPDISSKNYEICQIEIQNALATVGFCAVLNNVFAIEMAKELQN